MRKVKIDPRATGLSLSNPFWAEDYLRIILERERPSLKEAIRKSPWTLKEMRRYAEEDTEFAELLHEAEKTDWVEPPPPIVDQMKAYIQMSSSN